MTILYEKNQVCLRTARPEDAALFAKVLRPADKAELMAVWPGISLKELIRQFIQLSSSAVILFYRGDMVAVGGIYPLTWLSTRACVWLLTGKELSKIPVTFFKLAKRLLGVWLRRYPLLTNRVDNRYHSACRFITQLGGVWTGHTTRYSNIQFLEFIFRRNYGRNCK